MKRHLIAATLLSASLAAPIFAQTAQEMDRKETSKQLERDHKANEAQAKADKAEAKALNTKKAKKAAKAQDKADRKIDDATSPGYPPPPPPPQN